MKKYTLVLILTTAAVLAYAQQGDTAANRNIGGASPEYIGVDSAQQELREISLDKFEDDGFWVATMPRDHGFITIRRFEGTPLDKRDLEGEREAGIDEPDTYVLGVKVQHLRRAVTYFSIKPIRPIAVPGITKILSMWVVGRNVKHEIYFIIQDEFGNRAKLPLGNLAFSGWKELRTSIPPHIRQSHPRYNSKQGIRITEILIETDPAETYGSYYLYLDDLRAVTDLFAENNRDIDDMNDSW